MRGGRLVVGGRCAKYDDVLSATSESTVLTLACNQWVVINVESQAHIHNQLTGSY